MTNLQRVLRPVWITILSLLAVAAVVYAGDFIVWKLRGANGMGKVEVTRVEAAQLKNNKEEYYPAETYMADCSRSLFPQAGAGTCWYLKKHPEVVVRY